MRCVNQIAESYVGSFALNGTVPVQLIPGELPRINGNPYPLQKFSDICTRLLHEEVVIPKDKLSSAMMSAVDSAFSYTNLGDLPVKNGNSVLPVVVEIHDDFSFDIYVGEVAFELEPTSIGVRVFIPYQDFELDPKGIVLQAVDAVIQQANASLA